MALAYKGIQYGQGGSGAARGTVQQVATALNPVLSVLLNFLFCATTSYEQMGRLGGLSSLAVWMGANLRAS